MANRRGRRRLITIAETTWFVFILWIALIAVGLSERIIAAFGAIIGLFFGILLVNDAAIWIGLPVLGLNIYLLYKAVFVEQPK